MARPSGPGPTGAPVAAKNSLEDLAILGGQPAFPEPLHVGRPNVMNRERLLERLNDLLDRRWLTNNGPYVQELERALAARLGVKHCVATCNATLALELVLRAADLNGEVIVPSFTFVATAHALQWLGITPVFCDVDLATHNIDPDLVEALITPRTTAILGVHLWGRPCDVKALADIARRHRLTLLFDAAHALGCSLSGRMVGGFGEAEVFSLHATKFVNAFEGGAVTTNDDRLAARVRAMRNFGFAGEDTVVSVGTNAKMSEASAAMGLTSLECMDDVIAINRRNYAHYRRLLGNLVGIRLLPYDERERSNFQHVVVEVDPVAAGLDRDTLRDVLRAENVLARRYFHPGVHRMEPYRSSLARPHLPRTELLTDRVLSLPTGTAAGPWEIEAVYSILRVALAGASEVKGRASRAAPPANDGGGSPP